MINLLFHYRTRESRGRDLLSLLCTTSMQPKDPSLYTHQSSRAVLLPFHTPRQDIEREEIHIRLVVVQTLEVELVGAQPSRLRTHPELNHTPPVTIRRSPTPTFSNVTPWAWISPPFALESWQCPVTTRHNYLFAYGWGLNVKSLSSLATHLPMYDLYSKL